MNELPVPNEFGSQIPHPDPPDTMRRRNEQRTVTTTPSDAGPQTLIADRYELQEQIAEGGMGVVYRALDRTLIRDVAIKLVKHTARRMPGRSPSETGGTGGPLVFPPEHRRRSGDRRRYGGTQGTPCKSVREVRSSWRGLGERAVAVSKEIRKSNLTVFSSARIVWRGHRPYAAPVDPNLASICVNLQVAQ